MKGVRRHDGQRPITYVKLGSLNDWYDDPEFQRAVRDAQEAKARAPNVLDWAQYQAEKARDR